MILNDPYIIISCRIAFLHPAPPASPNTPHIQIPINSVAPPAQQQNIQFKQKHPFSSFLPLRLVNSMVLQTIIIKQMFFPEQQPQRKAQQKIFYIYDTNDNTKKPYEIKATHKKITINDIKKIFNAHHIRLFNSDGAEYFDDDIKYIKNKAVLYATKGEEFDSGNCFGEYEMTDKLGEGGFGNVYLARHRQTGQKYAIKIIKTENIGSVSDIDSIFVEAEILKSLNHQNIVKVHNCLTLKNMEVAIIMELLQGGQLLKYVEKEGRLNQKTAQVFFRQIVKGMKYCHQNNLIHRDLKLENILLVNSEEKKVKIIDFGIAGAINFFTQEDLDTGSLSYMAPECFMNQKDYKIDGRIDVWACGVILYCMLHGQLPFKGTNNHEIIESIKSGSYKINPMIEKTVSEGCIEVLKQCLEVNAKKRITMEELADHPWIQRNIFGTKEQIQQKKPMQIIKEIPKQKPKKILPSKNSFQGSKPVQSKPFKK